MNGPGSKNSRNKALKSSLMNGGSQYRWYTFFIHKIYTRTTRQVGIPESKWQLIDTRKYWKNKCKKDRVILRAAEETFLGYLI